MKAILNLCFFFSGDACPALIGLHCLPVAIARELSVLFEAVCYGKLTGSPG